MASILIGEIAIELSNHEVDFFQNEKPRDLLLSSIEGQDSQNFMDQWSNGIGMIFPFIMLYPMTIQP